MSGGYIAAISLAIIGVALLAYLFFIRKSHSEDYAAYIWFMSGAFFIFAGALTSGITWIINWWYL